MASSVKSEIAALEEALRQAELGPDPNFFATHVDDEMIFVAGGQAAQPKAMIVEAHTPGTGKGQKFTRVEMSEMRIIDQGTAAVVTCKGEFEGPNGTQMLKFMRVWVKKPEGWRIVAGAMI
jgi:ketosteroid isomerase-like protein